MLLNCDLGESFGSWRMGLDEEVMPFLDQANVACGFHGGDPLTMERTLKLAAEHGVSVGAHPAYPDLVGFGRRSMALSADELRSTLLYQIAAIDGMAKTLGVDLQYVKPHGALYNDMMANSEVRNTVMQSVAAYAKPLTLMLQATTEAQSHRSEASSLNLPLYFEAFADRCYDDDGRLLSRRKPGAVHDRDRMLAQVEQLARQSTVTTVSGETLTLQVDSLCVHGDNAEGVNAIREIRQLLADD
ncbi:5-oxoprolinase subunit PxpA [Congregibacter brevis]|uniref:5-oxoprolinase subunit PxpA n=1 Tax=Congregibacter brevis TaxID=3081201 RepID=A0ABZ0ICP8_9GAMM|nr:5-oxoprolinase subunit PxpA [Congregibacter sp. IMCC45268]